MFARWLYRKRVNNATKTKPNPVGFKEGKNMAQVPKLYRQDPDHRMSGGYLDDATYAAAITSFVFMCTDAVIVNSNRRTIFLANRCVKPMMGLWIIGGRWFAGETRAESMVRCFKRETGLDVVPDRFGYVYTNEYMWAERRQEPQNVGSHNVAYTFRVSLTDAEIAAAAKHLNPDEYDREFGLREFNREDLVRDGAHEAILDLYDEIFG